MFDTLITAMVSTIGGSLVTGLVLSAKSAFRTRKMLEELIISGKDQTAMSKTMYRVMRVSLQAQRCQCQALKELGANGSVSKAFEHLDVADKHFDDNLVAGMSMRSEE